MKKTYTVHALQHKEVSPGRGSIVWLLSDERGFPRKISAITSLDEDGVIDSIQAVYRREIPLIKELHHVEKGDVFTIDFTDFNRREGYVVRDVYQDMTNQHKLMTLSDRFRKHLLALGAVALLWFTYTALNDVSMMGLNWSQ